MSDGTTPSSSSRVSLVLFPKYLVLPSPPPGVPVPLCPELSAPLGRPVAHPCPLHSSQRSSSPRRLRGHALSPNGRQSGQRRNLRHYYRVPQESEQLSEEEANELAIQGQKLRELTVHQRKMHRNAAITLGRRDLPVERGGHSGFVTLNSMSLLFIPDLLLFFNPGNITQDYSTLLYSMTLSKVHFPRILAGKPSEYPEWVVFSHGRSDKPVTAIHFSDDDKLLHLHVAVRGTGRPGHLVHLPSCAPASEVLPRAEHRLPVVSSRRHQSIFDESERILCRATGQDDTSHPEDFTTRARSAASARHG